MAENSELNPISPGPEQPQNPSSFSETHPHLDRFLGKQGLGRWVHERVTQLAESVNGSFLQTFVDRFFPGREGEMEQVALEAQDRITNNYVAGTQST